MKDFTPYNESLELKELGFDEPCFALYSIIEHDDIEIGDFYFGPSYATNATEGVSILVPTFSQAFRFFREKYGLDSAVLENRYVIETKEDLPNWYYGFKTYEEAELACLQKLIQIVKDEKHTRITN